MIYNSQFEYDNASEPEFDNYQDEPPFAEFAEYGTLELLNGCDWRGMSSEILLIDLELAGGGYQVALEWVCKRLTEKQYREWLNG